MHLDKIEVFQIPFNKDESKDESEDDIRTERPFRKNTDSQNSSVTKD